MTGCVLSLLYNNVVYSDFIELSNGTYVQKATIFPVFTVLMGIGYVTLSMRGVAKRGEPRTLTSRVTTRACGRDLAGIKMQRSHA